MLEPIQRVPEPKNQNKPPKTDKNMFVGIYYIKENNGSTFIIDPGAYKTGPGPPGAPPGCPGAAPGAHVR